MKRVQRFPTAQSRLREQALWDAALESAKDEPNKYARLLRSVMLGAAALSGLMLLVLTGLSIVFGAGPVVEAVGSTEFLYGVVMRGLLMLSAAIFVGYLLTGWSDDSYH